MIPVRCIGWDAPCGRPVDQERGGAWCTEHRPVDRAGEQWDTAATLCYRTSEYRIRRIPRVRGAR